MRGRTVGLLGVALATAACASLQFDVPSSTGSPTPTITTTGTATPVASLPPIDLGDGSDGNLLVGIGGVVVNTCHAVSGSGTTLSGSDVTGFVAGRRLLLVQLATGSSSPSGATALVDDSHLGASGLWELTTVTAAIDAGSVSVGALSRSYSSVGGGHAIACTVPQYASVALSGGGVTDNPWNGSVGGVIALLVDGTFSVASAAHVSAAGDGWRGGLVRVNASGSDVTALDTAAGTGGGKGEGLSTDSRSASGRGARLDAGGGGTAAAGGGGGGGGAGSGGRGGPEASQDPNTIGFGGGGHDGSTVRLLFGGGGGAGQQGASRATAGKNGGGIILIAARRFENSGSIYADGDTQAAGSANDGSGGGGGGGSILLWSSAATPDAGVVHAHGGGGGSPAGGFGAGGGGGGGAIFLHGFASVSTVDASGGPGGTTGAASTVPATAGSNGRVVTLP